jgi:hypothetical protein
MPELSGEVFSLSVPKLKNAHNKAAQLDGFAATGFGR